MWTVEEQTGNGGLKKVRLAAGGEQQQLHAVEVYLFGATLTSWVHQGRERIFVSPTAIWNGVKAIRGGIPVVFPQFGQPDTTMAQHGFARNQVWSVVSHDRTAEGATLVLSLRESEESMRVWPHAFQLTYTVRVTSSSLHCELAIHNTGSAAFKCHSLLHTYLTVKSSAAEDMRVDGLTGFSFKDKTRGNAVFVDDAPAITVASEVDRVYIDGSNGHIGTVVVHDRIGGDAMAVSKGAVIRSADGSEHPAPADVVVWNPWSERAATIADLAPGSYERYVCIEPGTVADYVSVDANDTLVLSQELKLL